MSHRSSLSVVPLARGAKGEAAWVEDRCRSRVMMMANMRINGFAEPLRVRVRDISSGGMKGDCVLAPDRGTSVTIELPNIGLVQARVAWSVDDSFGLTFDRAIDASEARSRITGSYKMPEPEPEPEKKRIF